MKIIFDTDGTLTDFNEWIQKYAILYFEKNYGYTVVYPDELEIEDMLDLKKRLMAEKGLTAEEAEKEMKMILDKFWISIRFIKFSLFSRFREGVSKLVNKFIKQGHEIQVHTSRAKTTENNIIGEIARKFTIWQYRMNGIYLPEENYYFYENDSEKIKGIIKQNPQIVFEDKPEIINSLNENKIKTICVSGKHNFEIKDTKLTAKIETFEENDVIEKMDKLLEKRLDFYTREIESKNFYNIIRLSIPTIMQIFQPIVLNENNLIHTYDEPVIYAPNHRSTLDPLVVNAYIDENIHWAALKRFFDGEDSIFNNSKNKILCKITSECFKKLSYFPIERISDNPNANNFNSLKEMNNFLKINGKVGIFAEGTTRRSDGQDFGNFDPSFLTLAKNTGAIVQPITIFWIKDENLKHKLIINFGKPFKIECKNINEAFRHFLEVQKELLEESKNLSTELKKVLK